MSRRALEPLTEAMFYVLMAFMDGERCGIDAAAFIKERTEGRVSVGPGTLYTVLATFLENGLIQETFTEGRKRTYAVTADGRGAYARELARLRRCVGDAEKEGVQWVNTSIG